MHMKARIAHTILSVSDFNRSVKFYDALMGALGFKVGLNEHGDWGGVKSYKQGEHGLYIQYEADQKYSQFNRFPGLNHIAFGVSEKQHVDQIYQLVQTLGVKITRSPKEYPEYADQYYAFYFRDPDGMPLEVAYM